MTVKINGKDVELKWTFRSMIYYENIQGKSFSPTSTTEVLVFLYCCILASEKDLIFTFDDFLDMVDENPQLIVDFSQFIESQINKNNNLTPLEDNNEYIDLESGDKLNEEETKKK